MEQQKEKQVIFFSDLLFSVLYRWKALIAAVLILALALGGFQLYQNSKPCANVTEEAQASLVHAQRRIKTISQNIKSQQEYLANSLLMTMDPYQVSRITTDFYVYTDYQIIPGMDFQNPDQSPAVLRAYKMLLSTDEALDAFCQATGLERLYLSELISAEVVTNSNVLSITIRCSDDQTAQKLNDAVVVFLRSKQNEIATQITDHTVSVITTAAASPVDTDLAKLQDEAVSRLTTLQNAMVEANANLTAVQNLVSETSATSPVVMAVLGAVLGVFLVAAWSVVCHLASDKVYSGRVLENRTGIRVLGAVPGSNKYKLIKKLEGRATTPAMDVIAMNIRNYCDGKDLLCLGQWSEDKKQALSEALKDVGITATFEGSLLTSAEALKQLKQHEAVVLLDSCGTSRYDQIQKQMLLIADQDKALLGCVLLGG